MTGKNQRNEKVEVNLTLINQRGEVKQGHFFMEKQIYDDLFSAPISNEARQNYLIDEYHEYERERKRRKKYVLVQDITILQKMLNEDQIISPEEVYFKELAKIELQNAIQKLTKDQQELIYLIFYEGLTKREVADKYQVSKQAFNGRLQRIYKKLKKYLK